MSNEHESATRPRRRSSRSARRLDIHVVHGSLEHAAHPVVVGHYQGMPLDGAEKALDECMHGLLGERLLLGAYAEQEGSAIVVPAMAGTTPSGAIVLGLGSAGDVTAEKVTRAMTQATLLRALAAAETEDGDREPEEIGISAVLVGANPLDGISIARSLAALVEGVTAALHLLAASGRLATAVRLRTLEIMERYEARAELAVQALDSLSTLVATGGADVPLHPVKKLTRRAGARAGGLPSDYNAGAWLRLDIRRATSLPAPPEGFLRLELTSAARRARADRLEQTLERATVDGLIAEAVTQTHPDPQIANTLYELLLPNELKPDLQGADNLALVLDPDSARYPWEALAPRADDGELAPLALRSGVLRQFADPETRNAPFSVRHAAGRYALVIGNPPAGTAPDLPGAAEEASHVAGLLAGSGDQDEALFEVCSLTWSDRQAQAVGLPLGAGNESWADIVNALYRYQYRVVHIAAHGAFDPDHPAQSGVVIGPERFLTAQTVAQFSAVPELVFLNCCYSGRIEDADAAPNGRDRAHLLAASVARQLMGIGVRAVVAAGWSVDDAAALAFATTFYEQMIKDSAGFGDAVKAARRAASKASDSITWAAYQCYGDPAFRLRAS
jgi:hypothetical protein